MTMVEVWSALARRRREASISAQYHTDALAAFREDCQTFLRFVEFEQDGYELAGGLLEDHPLHAYDAVQLASALVAAQALTAADLPQPVFVCSDERLLRVALEQGLPTDNPNNHP
jgi:hypothetical protein